LKRCFESTVLEIIFNFLIFIYIPFEEDSARDRFARMKAISEDGSLRKKAFNFALELYRNGVIPKICVRTFARRYFRKRIEGGF